MNPKSQNLEPIIFEKLTTNPIFTLASKIYQINDILKKEIEKILKKHQLTFYELEILVVLHENEKDFLKPSDLYKKLLFSTGGITKLIQRLEKKNYITKEIFLDDLRAKPISITTKGEQVVLEVFPKILKIEKDVFSKLNKEEISNISNSLEKLITLSK
ncbi:MarR family winged helix-turn-helix transcriptional regulator [Malaciobacter mytili]|uniref:MarR family winged helix-turn-helix transcriptional regulator n=1 Tax=Malaciobacter mytili TaxID=603050 RepID=UPI003A86493E